MLQWQLTTAFKNVSDLLICVQVLLEEGFQLLLVIR